MAELNGLKIIELPGARGNSVPSYDSIQKFILPHMEMVQVFWWSVWWCVLAMVAYKFIIMPNVRAWRKARQLHQNERVSSGSLSETSSV